MNTPRRFTAEDLALFAMQLLPQDEAAEVLLYVEQTEEGRRELAQIQGDLAIYAYTADQHSPQAQARERFLKQVSREKKAVSIDRPVSSESVKRVEAPTQKNGEGGENVTRVAAPSFGGSSYLTDEIPRRSVAAKVFPWIGWAVAAGLAVAAGELYHEREGLQTAVATQATKMDHLTADAAAARQVLDALTDTSAMRVTLTKGKVAPVPQGRATYVADKGTLIFVANNLEQLPESKAYELWLIPAEAGRDPIPAGTFHPDDRGNASVILPPLPKGVEAKAFGVTVEDKDGSSTPTLPIILVGA